MKKFHVQIYYYLSINKVNGKYDTTMSFDAIKKRNE